MKRINIKLYPVFLLAGAILFAACKKDDLNSDAEIIISFRVTNENGKVFNSKIENDEITIKVSPYLDAEVELAEAVPSFYLSRGATVTPDPSLPQNFAQQGGVKYTVTSEDGTKKHVYSVSWGISDKLPYGEGFSYAEIGAQKSFVDLGYPGTQGNFDLPSIEYGDLQMYHAYCGNSIVLLSRAYIAQNPASPHCVKVVDRTSLNVTGSLNTGSITLADLKMITSDYKGRCVGAVVSGSETEFFYWVNPTDAPRSIGKIGINMAPSNSDLSNNFQVAGDVTGNAWITALAPRGNNGAHYRVKVTNGQLASTYSTIETGYSSSDCVGFQMISPLDDSDEPNFVVGDTEGTAGAANSIHVYLNTSSGSTLYVMPGLWQNILQAWWVGTGFTTERTGGRSPVVNGMVINGKSYVAVTSGTAWWHAATVLTPDLQPMIQYENLNIAFSITRGWSYGSWLDWYWNEDASEAYLAVWFGRLGLYTYKLTCFE
jgi:hypothetical protein